MLLPGYPKHGACSMAVHYPNEHSIFQQKTLKMPGGLCQRLGRELDYLTQLCKTPKTSLPNDVHVCGAGQALGLGALLGVFNGFQTDRYNVLGLPIRSCAAFALHAEQEHEGCWLNPGLKRLRA